MPALLALVLLLAAPDLDSKVVKDRLEAVAVLASKGGDGAEARLIGALKDNDWEVIHRAIEALAKRGGAASVKPLANLAVTGPVRRIRLAAALSLKAVDLEEAHVPVEVVAGAVLAADVRHGSLLALTGLVSALI